MAPAWRTALCIWGVVLDLTQEQREMQERAARAAIQVGAAAQPLPAGALQAREADGTSWGATGGIFVWDTYVPVPGAHGKGRASAVPKAAGVRGEGRSAVSQRSGIAGWPYMEREGAEVVLRLLSAPAWDWRWPHWTPHEDGHASETWGSGRRTGPASF